jgi:hypothetical protein
MRKQNYKITDQIELNILNSTKEAADEKLNLFYERVNEIAYGMGISLDHGKGMQCEESD